MTRAVKRSIIKQIHNEMHPASQDELIIFSLSLARPQRFVGVATARLSNTINKYQHWAGSRSACWIIHVVKHLASNRERSKRTTKMISLFNYMAQVIHHVRHIKINTTTENYQSTGKKTQGLKESHVRKTAAKKKSSCLVISIHRWTQFILIYLNK